MQKHHQKRRIRLIIDLAVVVACTLIAVALVPRLTRSRTDPAPRPAPGNCLRFDDIVYAAVDGIQLRLDIVQPAVAVSQPRPIAVFIHGGAWRSGDKSGIAPYLAQLTQAGFLCCSVNYRLSTQAAFPAQIHDCKAAVRWIRTHAAEYGGDPDRIAVFGASAGGHLAALLGLSNGVAGLEGTVGDCPGASSDVQAAADWFGPSDFQVMDRAGMSQWHRGVLEQLFGGPLEDSGNLPAQASPVQYVDAGDPPVLIVHGTADETVYVGQSRRLVRALETAGVKVEYHEVEGGGHGRFRNTDPDLEELIGAMVVFFTTHLGAGPAADQG